MKVRTLIYKFVFFISFKNTDCVAQIADGGGREKTADRVGDDHNA